jgi:curved DNA-binding protein CbpA
VAWLRLVKELHPDAGFDGPAASDRLKAINLAYQTLKNPDQGQTEGRTDRRTFRSAQATFVIFLFVPIVGVALVMGTRTGSGPTREATAEVATASREEPKVGTSESTLDYGHSRDTQEKRSLVSPAHEADRPGALAGGARDQPGQGTDSTDRLGNEPRSVAMPETGATSDRVQQRSRKTPGFEDPNAYPSDNAEQNPQRALASLRAAEREQDEDEAAWSHALRDHTKPAFIAYLNDRPNGRHAQTALAKVAELAKEVAPVIAVTIKNGKLGAPSGHPSTSIAHSGHRWPTADEPFVGADGRIR